MKINELNTNLPNKKDEEFLKINFDSLFSTEFKESKIYEFDIMGLKTIKDENSYESVLFNITKSLDENQKVLTIDKNIAEPIFLIYKIKEDETLFSNSLKIEVKENIKAQVVEVFVNSSKNSAFTVNRNIILEENASLEYVKIQDINASNSMIFANSIKQEKSSNLEITNLEFGDGFIVNSFENIINKEFVNYELNGLIKLSNDSTTATLVKTIHNEKNSTSSINYKNSLKDSSKAVVKIKSIVNETAQFTKAFQNCNTILLSDDATIFAQPHLEILIDELEASHGTTTGTLNQDQLLYLCSRGIKKEKAYEMLLNAFESTIISNIKNEIIKEFVENYKREKYV
ncbi:SufD family Fe-S cluster assembly protein [Arcobacter ellisii]|uniref:Fe-S assembly protein n=1 Tax=Arcobacter ellisii TaxID=913109 RepID=A0A347U6H4_9BACT|nr:SufD family Fe-S cluster assembly protein [Arcobacter ellisii]AXX94452.1 [Fe-S] cluster assembly scaffold SufBCD, SufD protein [Arcobacter ellisii]RXI31150.1 Fe-S assembly protein [Arcobacter ellisii]